MGRTAVGVVALALALGGCSDGSVVGEDAPSVTDEVGADDGSDEAGAGTDTGTAGELSPDDPAVQDAILLTAIDEVLGDTRYADLVDEDPGAFLETAVTLCSSLDAGAGGDEVLAEFLETLRQEGLILDEDTAYLGGALLGAAVTVRCPEHEDEIAEVAS